MASGIEQDQYLGFDEEDRSYAYGWDPDSVDRRGLLTRIGLVMVTTVLMLVIAGFGRGRSAGDTVTV